LNVCSVGKLLLFDVEPDASVHARVQQKPLFWQQLQMKFPFGPFWSALRLRVLVAAAFSANFAGFAAAANAATLSKYSACTPEEPLDLLLLLTCC